jgi:hypothetical protein
MRSRVKNTRPCRFKKAPIRLSRKLRRQVYYTVEGAGAKVAWSRSESYRAVHRGEIPVELDGKYFRVPRKAWDDKVETIQQMLLNGKVTGT